MRPVLILAALATTTAHVHYAHRGASNAVWEPVPIEDPWRKEKAYNRSGFTDFTRQTDLVIDKGGNCGPPERLHAPLRNKLYFFAWVSGHDAALLRHFLVFYLARGVAFKEPGRAKLVVSPLKDSRRALLDGHNLGGPSAGTAPCPASRYKFAGSRLCVEGH